jgi:hypothetical protein
MKYLKTFESYKRTDIHEDIADDLLPRLEKIRSEKGYYTVEDYEKYMIERGADDIMINSVMHYLVNKGFDFDSESEEELPDGWENEIKIINK